MLLGHPTIEDNPIVDGNQAANFELMTSSDCRGELAPHAFCTLTVRYNPTLTKSIQCSYAVVVVPDDDQAAPKQQVGVQAGTGCLKL
jgi:hypothetical protein